MHYQKFKRNENPSVCNICLQTKKLSWDHVPPKGGIQLSAVEQESLLSKFTVPEENKKHTFSQNGVKFRTICGDCNSFLGLNYDTELNFFVLKIKEYIESKLTLPSKMVFTAKPNKIIKSILGHFLAAKVYIENTKIDEKIRSYYFSNNCMLPNDLKLFYWIYPYQKYVIIRDIMMPSIRGNLKNFVFFSIIKYYPIAFLLTSTDKYSGLNEFSYFSSSDIEDEYDIPIDFRIIKEPDWPEIVDAGNMIFGGQSLVSSVSAGPR